MLTNTLLERVWSRDLHHRPQPHSIATDAALVVLERSSKVSRIDPATGHALWSASVPNVFGWITTTPEHVFVLGQHGLVQAFDAQGGHPLWSRDLGGIYGYVVARGDALLTGGWRGYTDVLCLDAASGAERWRFPSRGQAVARPVAAPWGVLLPSLETRRASIADPATGRVRSAFELPPGLPAPDAGSLFASDGPMLFAATQHGDYLRLDTRSALRWEPLFHHPAGICTHRPRRVGDLILFQDGRGDLCGYGLTDGRLHWRRSLAHNRADVLPAAALGEDCIAVGTSFGQVLTLAPDGTELGHQSVAKRVGTDMIATENGVIFGTQGAIVGYRRVS